MHSFQMYECCVTTTVNTWILPGQTLQYYSITYGMAGLLWIELLQCMFESSWPSVAFSQYQYNYPEINNVVIIISYSLKTNAYPCSFSCIRLRNPLHQSLMTSLWTGQLRNRDLILNRGKRLFCSPECPRFSLLPTKTSILGVSGIFPGIKWLVHEVDRLCILNLCWG